MLIIIICVIILFIGLLLFFRDCYVTVFGWIISCFIGAAIIGGLVGLLFACLFGDVYSDNPDNCDSSNVQHDLIPYTVDETDYYVFLSDSSDGLTMSVQYYDDEGIPQTLHLNGQNDYVFDKKSNPSITITTYTPRFNPWVLNVSQPSDEYTITLHDKSSIYQGIG